jgi:hypothetical protein
VFVRDVFPSIVDIVVQQSCEVGGDSHEPLSPGPVLQRRAGFWAEAPGGNDRALLWRDYAEEGGVSFGERDGESVLVTYDVGVTTPIAPGETVEKRYELRPGFDRDALTGYGFDAPGRYVVAETLNYHRHRESQGPSTEVDWSVEFELEAI